MYALLLLCKSWKCNKGKTCTSKPAEQNLALEHYIKGSNIVDIIVALWWQLGRPGQPRGAGSCCSCSWPVAVADCKAGVQQGGQSHRHGSAGCSGPRASKWSKRTWDRTTGFIKRALCPLVVPVWGIVLAWQRQN